ncbi:MAG: MarR family transcriptional regulator [Spirochaetes bacterium]|nr:MarR family transcriptional regulator [Spirochaetota bacterium]MBU0956465.1 MarR family transcriptional regulator [Spirochaetota bacterium]
MSFPELQLSNQLCFMVYRLDRAIMARYRPLLTSLGLTYPQYLVLLALWEQDRQSVGELCKRLDLETGTVSPLLKRLVALGLIEKERRSDDERAVCVCLSEKGRALEQQALSVPASLASCLLTGPEEYLQLKTTFAGLLARLEKTASEQALTK